MSTRGQYHSLTQESHSVTFSYISKATRPIVTKFHVESPGAEGTKNMFNGSGHMTNMAALPIYGKTFKIFAEASWVIFEA